MKALCDCIASGNQNKPKQHGADPHAKNCAIYIRTTEPDYVTVLPTDHPRKFLAVIMKWHARDDEYIQGRVSVALTTEQAHALARIWAEAAGLEVRL